MLIFQGCSYLDAVLREKESKEIMGTKAYYDNKCLVAEECAGISGKVRLPIDDKSNTLAVVVVLEDGNETRAIDAEVIDFSPQNDEKVSYFFFDLPVGTYTLYILKTDNGSNDFQNRELIVLEKEMGSVTTKDLQAYQNAIILDDAHVSSRREVAKFPYSLKEINERLAVAIKSPKGSFDKNVSLDDSVFSHHMAMEGLYYPESFKRKTKPFYRLVPEYKDGTIPLILVHGMGGTPRDWKFMLEHIDMEHFTPYAVYYPSGEDFSKLAALFNEWILSDRIFENAPRVIVAHSYGGVIVREAFNLTRSQNDSLFISLASPFGGDEKASKGVKNAPYVLPAWRSIADDGDFINNLYRNVLSPYEQYELIFTYNNHGDGPSGDGHIPLKKQLRSEAYNEAESLRGFDEDHMSVVNSKEAAEYINALLLQFVKEHPKK